MNRYQHILPSAQESLLYGSHLDTLGDCILHDVAIKHKSDVVIVAICFMMVGKNKSSYWGSHHIAARKRMVANLDVVYRYDI